MPRLRNTRTGSVVNVSDATAARLGAEYEPVGAPGSVSVHDADGRPIGSAEPAKPRKSRAKSAKK